MATIGSSSASSSVAGALASSLSPAFTAGGLASGLDTNSIVSQLVTIESQPIQLLQQQQQGLQSQVSALGDLMSKLSDLQTATDALASNGVLAVSTASSTTSFTATPGAGAAAGRYTVQVDSLARAAKARSAAFSSSGAPVAGGTLTLTVQGKAYPPITIADGTSLSDVATAIRQSGAPVSATILSDGTSSYLSVTALDTGYPVSGAPADALGVAFAAAPGATGQDPAFAITSPATNAVLWVDGLKMTRTSNTVSDAIPGTTLTLGQEGGPAEDLVLANDAKATQAKLQQFVDAYNAINSVLQQNLSPGQGTDRSSTLTGDSAVRELQAKMQTLTSAIVPGLSSVRSLADLGVQTAKDGSLSIDATTLSNAITADPSAVNAIFSTATTGIGAVVDGLVNDETAPVTGTLSADQSAMNDSISRLGDQITAAQARVATYQQTLLAEFAAMEQTVSSLKAVGNYLTAQAQAQQQTASK